jgi:hypothetical protein
MWATECHKRHTVRLKQRAAPDVDVAGKGQRTHGRVQVDGIPALLSMQRFGFEHGMCSHERLDAALAWTNSCCMNVVFPLPTGA